MGFFSKAETDPVCKMKVDPKTAKHTLVWESKTYYFCSPGCKTRFEGDPKKFLDAGAPGHAM